MDGHPGGILEMQQAGHTSGKHPLYLHSRNTREVRTWAAHRVGFCAGRHHLASGPSRAARQEGWTGKVWRLTPPEAIPAGHTGSPSRHATHADYLRGSPGWGSPGRAEGRLGLASSVLPKMWGQHAVATPSPHTPGQVFCAHTQGPSQGRRETNPEECPLGLMSHREHRNVKNILR